MFLPKTDYLETMISKVNNLIYWVYEKAADMNMLVCFTLESLLKEGESKGKHSYTLTSTSLRADLVTHTSEAQNPTL